MGLDPLRSPGPRTGDLPFPYVYNNPGTRLSSPTVNNTWMIHIRVPIYERHAKSKLGVSSRSCIRNNKSRKYN